MLAVAIAFAIAIPLGFWLRPRPSALPDTALGVVVVVVLLGIAAGEVTLETQYGCEIDGQGPRAIVRSADGTPVQLRDLLSQSDLDPPKTRRPLRAMDLWR
ncbi:hypothetical protein SBA3_2160010 [Candidatus Sulfopaludibacter sp. SbA3]|nr:hypothetical protein SBA3_2160010 [Candidatus Sulfopaludibacter sp. SbA3]